MSSLCPCSGQQRQLPVEGDLEPRGKRRRPAPPPCPKASVVTSPLSTELTLTLRASLDKVLVACDDSPGGVHEDTAEGHIPASTCEQLHGATS